MRTSILIFLLLATGCATLAQAETAAERLQLFYGKDERVEIKDMSVAPWSAIGKLETQRGILCSATLVAPDQVLTAGHCFFMLSSKKDQGKWFYAGYRNGKYQAKYRILSATVDPHFSKGLRRHGRDVYINPSVASYDIALLKVQYVAGRRDIAPMPMFSGDRKALAAALSAAGHKVNQAGYASDHRETLSAHLGCTATQLEDNNTVSHRCNTLSGDSGSPLWLDLADGPRLIAVQSSAPDAVDRQDADNTAVTILQARPLLAPAP